jgi:hypothetical protein
MNLEHHGVPDSKLISRKQTWEHSKGHRSQLKELHEAKTGAVWLTKLSWIATQYIKHLNLQRYK